MVLQMLLPEVVKNSILKNEIIESLRSQAVILIFPVKTRRAAVGAEHNVFSANLTPHCVSGILPRGAPTPCCLLPKPPPISTALCCM